MTTCPCQSAAAAALDLDLLDRLVAEHSRGAGSLIPVLQKAQDAYGYLPKIVLERIAGALRVPESTVYGVATFYAQFRLKPVGKHIIRVCHGTACHVAGAEKITEAFSRELQVADGATTPDRQFTLESVACLGCCSLAPCAMIDRETYAKLDGPRVARVVKDIRQSSAATGAAS